MKTLFLLVAILILLFAALLGIISPDSVSLPLYLVVLAFFYAISTIIILIVIKLFFTDISVQRQRFVATVCGFIPVGILALGSLSRLTFLDVLLVTTVPLLIVWYAIKRGAIK